MNNATGGRMVASIMALGMPVPRFDVMNLPTRSSQPAGWPENRRRKFKPNHRRNARR